jgi:hypothetical protein
VEHRSAFIFAYRRQKTLASAKPPNVGRSENADAVALASPGLALAIAYPKLIFGDMDTVTRPDAPADSQPELAAYGAALHIAVALGLLGHEHTVERKSGESDKRYQSRCDLLAALLGYAKRG